MGVGKRNNYNVATFYKTLSEKYLAGISNVFFITGNIGDYAIPGKLTIDYLIDGLADLGMDRVFSYDISNGKRLRFGEGGGGGAGDDWASMLHDLGENTNQSTAYIIEYPEFLIGKSQNGYVDDQTKTRLVDLHQLINSQNFILSENMLILISEVRSDVHDMFFSSNSRLYPIEIQFPNESERLEMIEYLHRTSEKEIEWELTKEQFANLTAGLSRTHIEDLYLLSEDKGVLSREHIMKRKEELIRKEFGEVIEIFDAGGYDLDQFAGQEHIKAYHREAVIEPIQSGETDIVPKGILYMGPPGTGKTYFAKCLAGEAGINFVEFKMSKILDKYVGEAERNLEKAFNCFTSLAPVGVFIDEMDQALSREDSSGSSVNRNLFGMFLSFLSKPEHRGKIVWIGATNYPNKLDEALKRAGRFDKKMPFLPPNEEDRKRVFQIHLDKLDYPTNITSLDDFGRRTEGYTQAEIEGVIIKALEVARRKRKDVIDDEVLAYALDCMMAYSNPGVREMTEIALEECNDLEFLPKNYREEKREKAASMRRGRRGV